MTPKRERINKLHQAISTRRDTATPSLTFTMHEKIYFNAGAAQLCKMKLGCSVQFERADKYWYFFVCKNDNTGFKLFQPDKRSPSLCVSSKNLIAYFNKTTNNLGKNKFYIQNTSSEVNGNPLFEIITKPVIK